jgi:hypothetical protein
MHTGKGQVVELMLENGLRHARIACLANMTPSPGQYLLAGDASDAPLPVSLFFTDSAPDGFIAAPPMPETWNPGQEIYLRGPFGRGFVLPSSARKVGLAAFDDSSVRLRGLIQPALKQGAAVVLVSKAGEENLPDEVEIQPLSSLSEILDWTDYAAFDIARENLPELREMLRRPHPLSALKEAQILVRTPVPCGGIAECGVCAVILKSDWKLACKDGPVFDWREI